MCACVSICFDDFTASITRTRTLSLSLSLSLSISLTHPDDAIVLGIQAALPAAHRIAFTGLAMANIDSVDMLEEWVTYFLDKRNHRPGVPLDSIRSVCVLREGVCVCVCVCVRGCVSVCVCVCVCAWVCG
jgi:hypothetical protein